MATCFVIKCNKEWGYNQKKPLIYKEMKDTTNNPI